MVRSGRFGSSYIKRIGRILCGALIGVGFLIVFIVNNRNILTEAADTGDQNLNCKYEINTNRLIFFSLNLPILFS